MIWQSALTILATTLVTAAALGLGRPFVKYLPGSLTSVEQLAMRGLFGAGVLGLLLFLIGQLVFTPLVIGFVIGGCVIMNFLPLPNRFHLRRSAFTLDRRNAGIYLAGLILLVLALAALANPVGGFGNDAVSYHLLGPVNWLREGKIRPALDSSLTAFPASVETLFAAVMALSHNRAPGILGVVFAGILLVQIWGLSKRIVGDSFSASLSVGLAATMPVVMFTADMSFVDVPFAAFTLAAARLAFDSSNRSELAMAGAYSGFALGTKYTGMSTLLATAIILLIARSLTVKRSDALLGVAIFGATAVVISSPWYIRNFSLLGTPIYPPPPALARLFSARAFPMAASESLQAYVRERGQGLGRGFTDFLLLPIRLTYWTHRFHGAGGIGVAPLAMAPLGIFRLRRLFVARIWLVWSLVLTILWFITQQEARFLVHLLGVVAVFAGFGAKLLIEQTSLTGRIIAWSALLVSFAYGGAYLAKERVDSIKTLVSPAYAGARWQNEVPFASAFNYLNHSNDVRKVMILHPFVTPYYLDRPYIKIRGQYGERPVAGINTFPEASQHLSELGVSHVLDVRYVESDFEVPPSESFELVWATDDARIYRVKDQNADRNH